MNPCIRLRSWPVCVLVWTCVVLILLYELNDKLTRVVLFHQPHNGQDNGIRFQPSSRGFSQWPPFEVQALDPKSFGAICVPGIKFSIENIADMLKSWKHSDTDPQDCRDLYNRFTAIYSVEMRLGNVKIPETFKTKVMGWLGQRNELYKELFHQDIIHIINMYTRETTVFNPLRDKRPVVKPKESEEDYLERITKESAKSCDFCKYRNFTAQHEFGRVESKLSFSASNIFKLDKLHAVITIKDHDPVNWSFDQYMDMMRLTNVWLKKAHKSDPEAVFPSIIWDLLPKSGSSQLHPHNQVVLSPHHYHGVVENWRRGAEDYYKESSRNYFTDLVQLYSALGLTVTHKSAVALANLTPRKDNEVVVIAPRADDDFFELIYYVLRAFMDDLKKYSFSLGGGFPPLVPGRADIPAFVRIITRGVMTEIRTDIGALELFAATNVNIDPYKVIGVVKASVQKRAPKS